MAHVAPGHRRCRLRQFTHRRGQVSGPEKRGNPANNQHQYRIQPQLPGRFGKHSLQAAVAQPHMHPAQPPVHDRHRYIKHPPFLGIQQQRLPLPQGRRGIRVQQIDRKPARKRMRQHDAILTDYEQIAHIGVGLLHIAQQFIQIILVIDQDQAGSSRRRKPCQRLAALSLLLKKQAGDCLAGLPERNRAEKQQ